jgi:predicted nucleotidyltransferase
VSVLNKEVILNTLKEINPSIEKDGIKLLGLFGSYSRNEATENSDIDILIETTPIFLEKNKGLKAFLKLEELKNNLENIFAKKIDIIDKQGLIQKNNTYILNKAIYV